MFSKSSKKNSSKHDCFSGQISFNLLNNLYSKELGLLYPTSFINYSNSRRLDEVRLSKYRSISTLNHSVTWLNLDSVDSRLLLASRCDGNFVCVDVLENQINNSKNLKFLFDSSKLPSKNAHSHSIGCIQWYPIDSGMFFTSGMDQKFKVWDTNTLQTVDEYYLKHKIYSHHISLLMSSENKTLVALALDNGQVRFIDILSGSYTHTLKAHAHGSCVSVQWSTYDSNILASGGSDGRIAIWDIRSSKSCLMYLDYEKTSKIKVNSKGSSSGGGLSSSSSKSIAHSGPIVGLTYTPDGNHIISLGKDNHLRLWNATNGFNTLTNYGKVPLNEAVAEACLQISCTESCVENYVFIPSNKNLLVYNIFEGNLKQTYKGHFEPINCCTYNPILNEIYTGSKDRNILIWTPEKQQNLLDESSEKSSSSLFHTKNPYSLLSNLGNVSQGSNTNRYGMSTNNVSNNTNVANRPSLKRPLDNWSDEEA